MHLPTSTLGLLVNQLITIIKIRVSGILEKWKYRYTVYQSQENKQVTDKGYGRGVQARGNVQRYTQNRPDYT